MRSKLLIAAGAAGIAVTGVVMTTGVATAGHTNTLLEASLDGRNEVATDAKDRRLVGDPNGRWSAPLTRRTTHRHERTAPMRSKLLIAAGAAGIAVTGVVVTTGTATAGHTNTVLEATLDGHQEVAAEGDRGMAGDPDGSGEAYVFGIDANATTLCYVLTVDGIAPAAAAHIHEGARGENGPVVVNLAAPADGNAADCITEDRVLPNGANAFVEDAQGNRLTTVQEILANPEDYYVNVHNAEYPGGAIRGQLEFQTSDGKGAKAGKGHAAGKGHTADKAHKH